MWNTGRVRDLPAVRMPISNYFVDNPGDLVRRQRGIIPAFRGRRFIELPYTLNTDKICELFRKKVFNALVKEDLLDAETVNSMKTWEHSGFSVFASNPIPPADKERLLFVARYLKRCPVSCERENLLKAGTVPVPGGEGRMDEYGNLHLDMDVVEFRGGEFRFVEDDAR